MELVNLVYIEMVIITTNHTASWKHSRDIGKKVDGHTRVCIFVFGAVCGNPNSLS